MASQGSLSSVALKAGVSKGTVSKVLNNYPGLSESTRTKVLRAYGELVGRPWRRARRGTLRHRAITGNVAIVSTEESIFRLYDEHPDQTMARTFASLRQRLTDMGYHIVLGPAYQSDSDFIDYVQESYRRRFDGLAFFAPVSDELVDALWERRSPVVSLSGAQFDNPRLTIVCPACSAGARMVVDHLIGLGHQDIGYIGWRANHHGYLERFQGYLLSLSMAGIPCRQGLICQPDLPNGAGHTDDSVRREQFIAGFLDDLIASNQVPTAFVCVNDTVACKVVDMLQTRGLRVPGDVSVTGWGGELIARQRGLITVGGRPEAIGETAAQTVVDLIEVGGRRPMRQIVPVEMIAGTSTSAPRGAE